MKNVFILLLICSNVFAQDDLLKELEDKGINEKEFTSATFKGTRLVNGQSVETKKKGELEFIFAHRFGLLNGGAYELFGLDQAYVRLGLEYGVTDRLGFGVGRNSVDKTVDMYGRYKLIRQSKGAGSFPFTATLFSNMAIKTSPRKVDAPGIQLEDRMSYTTQLLLARKFNSQFSLQLMPTFLHKNTVDKKIENNDLIVLGVGGRYKISKSVAITSEYHYRLNTPDANPYYNAFGCGVDIETGGHVFQIVVTNTRGLTERAFLSETTGDVSAGDLHLGFNITRTFQISKPK